MDFTKILPEFPAIFFHFVLVLCIRFVLYYIEYCYHLNNSANRSVKIEAL